MNLLTRNLTEVMSSLKDDDQSKPSGVGKKRWTRVREAYRSGELDRQNILFHPERKRERRNALADISAVSTNADATSQKYQFHQLVERVRELQKEIVPDAFLYQMPQTYAPFSPMTPSSNPSRGSISIYPHRQSLSISSGSTNSLVPNQRFALSERILERAHQIPERFWIDWQKKQMQDQIEELEYIKSNMLASSNSSFMSNETDDVEMDLPKIDPRPNYTELRRKSLLFLHEAQRLADERRASLARAATIDESISDKDENEPTFNFDQRSEENPDTANLNDFKEEPSAEPVKPISTVELSPPLPPDCSRSAISLPFTYNNTGGQKRFSNEPVLEKVIEINDNAIGTIPPKNRIEITFTQVYSKATIHRRIEFHPFRRMPILHTAMSLTRDIPIQISTHQRKEIKFSQLSSPTLSFQSARSRFSSLEDLTDIHSSGTVILSSISCFSCSQSTSSSTPTAWLIINNHFRLKELSSLKYTCSIQDQPMNNVYELEQTYLSPSSRSEAEEEDRMSFSSTLFTCRRQKEKGDTSNLSHIPILSAQNNYDSSWQDKKISHKFDSVKIARHSSIISRKKTRSWKQNAVSGGFQRAVLTNDYITRSSSNSVAADRLTRRQRRKQTTLKRKTGSEKREEEEKKKKEKERNKKSLLPPSSSSSTGAEASLFQFFTLDTSAISSYPYEQTKCADKNTPAKEENCFSIQTSGEHHQRQKQEFKSNLIMADGHDYTTPKKKENIRVFVRRRRRSSQLSKRKYRRSSSSNHSHETLPSSSSTTHIEELVSLIQKQFNTKQKKSRNKNIIVVNYKPVFLNSRQQKPSKATSASIPKPKLFPTDDDFSSATHYSRRRSLTTTSSDGSPLRSPINRSRQEQTIPLDVPDVEDPLMFIEMMYQQLFTEDGRLRRGTEPTMLANCVKQIVNNSRRNSFSSSQSKQKSLNNTPNQQRKLPFVPTKSISLSSSIRSIPNEQYDTFSEEEEEEEEEEPKTVIQVNNQGPTIKINGDTSKSSKPSGTENPGNHSQMQAFLNSRPAPPLPPKTTNGFHFSLDDTDNEDLDTFSDLNSIRFNHKPIQTSPSVEDDLTQTDSRFLSSSGYQSLDRAKHSSQRKALLSKSHSDSDLSHSSQKTPREIKSIHDCPHCPRPPTVTVIPSVRSSLNLIQRIQQPVGMMFMKYLNFILISKNVLLLPLLIFLLRQRSMHT